MVTHGHYVVVQGSHGIPIYKISRTTVHIEHGSGICTQFYITVFHTGTLLHLNKTIILKHRDKKLDKTCHSNSMLLTTNLSIYL